MLRFYKGGPWKRQDVLVASVIHLIHNKVSPSGLSTINSNKQKQQGQKGKKERNPQKTAELPSIYETDWGPKEATSDKGDLLSLRRKSSWCTRSLTLQRSSHWSTSKYQNKEFINCSKATGLFYYTKSTRHNSSWNVLNEAQIFYKLLIKYELSFPVFPASSCAKQIASTVQPCVLN